MTEHPPLDVKMVTLRMPHGLHEHIADAARTDRRSVNAQIVVLLVEALDARTKADR